MSTTCKEHSGLVEANTQQERRLSGIEEILRDVRYEQTVLKVELAKVTVKVGLIVSAVLPAWNMIVNALAGWLPKVTTSAASIFFH